MKAGRGLGSTDARQKRVRGSIINVQSTLVFLSATSIPINRSSVSLAECEASIRAANIERTLPSAGHPFARTLINRA